ncbi:hypothetical protein RJI07_00845 [Mycoplasmatota bacterium WC30]
MEIRNKTLYDKDLIMNYNKFYLTSYIIRNFVVITAISMVFIIYMLAIQQWKYALLLVGILVFYLFMTYMMQKMTTKRLLKKSPLVEQPVLQTYIFRDNDFDITNIKTYTANYSNIIKLKMSKEFYILQSRDRKTYLVDYKGFDTESEKNKFDDFIRDMFKKKRRP